MLFCPNCGTKNKTIYNFCYRCGTKIKFSIEDMKPEKKQLIEFKINDYITLKLENSKTVIYVNDIKFLQCKYLLIEIPKNEFKDFDEFGSIDDVCENLNHYLEKDRDFSLLKPEIEFWGHCSNLQAWSENSYDTCLLHSNLAFPLLKKLTDVGDPLARRVFKDEIIERLTRENNRVTQYLIQENYLEYFNHEELDLIMEILYEQIKKSFKNKYNTILDEGEIETLLNIIKINLIHSKPLLINQIKPIEIVSKKTHLGFSYESKKIINLGFNRCGLTELPSSIGNFENLKELYLTENRLNSLPESIGDLKSLEKLNLSDNHLVNLPSKIGNLTNLKELHLNHNVIQNLPESISKLKKLEVLSIWGNQLRNLPKKMDEMYSMRVLGLSFNQLEEFPELISSLEILDLSNNNIQNIPKNIDCLKSLKILWVNNNPIKFIPDSLLDLQFLTDLYIVNTPISNQKDREVRKILDHLEEKDINIWQ